MTKLEMLPPPPGSKVPLVRLNCPGNVFVEARWITRTVIPVHVGPFYSYALVFAR